MSARELSLGRALAYLKAEQVDGKAHDGSEFSMTDKDYLQSLRERLQALDTPDIVDGSFQALPQRCCQGETLYLDDNEDFFLVLLLVRSLNENRSNECERIFKHLNDCFGCFEAFGEVMREYYDQSLSFSKNPERGDQ